MRGFDIMLQIETMVGVALYRGRRTERESSLNSSARTHLPSGVQVFVTDTRSQLESKKRCLIRLQEKIAFWQTEQMMEQRYGQW